MPFKKGNKLGCLHKGQIPWNKGKKRPEFSIEWKEKMRQGHIGKPSGAKGKHWKLSLESRKNQSKANKKRIAEGKHNFWKGGINGKDDTIRNSIEHKLWREAIFKRDDYKCRKCIKGGYLHPHHILNFSSHREVRFAIDNGITFCENCHYKFHKKYGFTNNTKEQLIEFLN
jgi:hypothetical protein